MKKSDKNMYSIIKILGITEIVLLSYFIIFLIINLIDSGEISIVLINKLFDILYSITLQMAFPIIIFIVIIAIPYLLTFVMVLVRFIRKYVNFKGKKKKQIIKFILLLTLTPLFILKGVSLVPLESTYEINVNKNASNISNARIKSFVQENVTEDKYIYKIKFIRGFPDDYNVKIFYKEGKHQKIANTFLNNSYYDFITTYAKDITNELRIKSIVFSLIGDILSIYFLIYILKEFKRISIKN